MAPAPHPSIHLPAGADAKLVQLTRSVRASNGQEFLAGMRAGFSPESACALVEAGFATWVGAAVERQEPAPFDPPSPVEPPQTAPVTRASVSHGDSPDGATTSEAAQPALQPARRRRG